MKFNPLIRITVINNPQMTSVHTLSSVTRHLKVFEGNELLSYLRRCCLITTGVLYYTPLAGDTHLKLSIEEDSPYENR